MRRPEDHLSGRPDLAASRPGDPAAGPDDGFAGSSDRLLLPGDSAAGPSSELLRGAADAEDRASEGALRPRSLAEFIGQQRVRSQLGLVLRAARERGGTADHVLMSGPPGLGKTTLAMIIAQEMSAPLRITSGPAIQHAGDLAAVLSSLAPGEVLFIDEIHRLARPAEEMLYVAMEDFRVDIIVGKGAGATAIPLELAPFTLVGATTRAGLLPSPLRDRFGFTAHMDFYTDDELATIIDRSAALLGVDLSAEGCAEIAGRSRGTPRVANRLLRRVRDYAEVHGTAATRRASVVAADDGHPQSSGASSNAVERQSAVGLGAARAALELFEVDQMGLDRLDRAVLRSLLRTFRGGPVGLSTLAVSVGEETETVETVAEPFLVRAGLISRTPRGRVATPQAWEHMGLVPPPISGVPAALQPELALPDSRDA